MRFPQSAALVLFVCISYLVSSHTDWGVLSVVKCGQISCINRSSIRVRIKAREAKPKQPVRTLSIEDSEMKRADISCGDAYPMYSPSLLGLWKNRVLWLLLWVAHSLPHGAHSSQTNWYRQREAVFPFISTECGEDEQSLFITWWYSCNGDVKD